MDMVATVIARFVFGLALDIMTQHEPQLQKQAHGVVKRRPANREILLSDEICREFIETEMNIYAKHSLQDSIALRGFAMVVHLKITVKL